MSTEENAQQKAKPRASGLGAWKYVLLSLPAYTYFFGYNAKKFFLEGLGFESPEISGEPGPVYESAFNGLIYINNQAIEDAWPEYAQSLEENLLIYSITALGVSVTLYITAKLAKFARMKREERANPHIAEPGPKPVAISLIAGLGTLAFNVAILPFVILAMSALSITLLPAAAVGISMAKEEISSFNCETPENALISACTTLQLTDKSTRLGRIYHKDSEYLYIFTASGAEAIPLNKVETRLRSRVAPASPDNHKPGSNE